LFSLGRIAVDEEETQFIYPMSTDLATFKVEKNTYIQQTYNKKKLQFIYSLLLSRKSKLYCCFVRPANNRSDLLSNLKSSLDSSKKNYFFLFANKKDLVDGF